MKIRQSILIVDDEELFGTILRRLLEKEGYVVSCCNNPSDAVNLSQKRIFDIIVTDYNMPNMNGADFARLMRCRFADSLIVGLSCETKASTFFEAGADAFFPKPIDYKELLSLIKQHKYIVTGKAAQNMISV